MQLIKSNLYREFLYKISDDHFYNALKITLCAVIAFVFFYGKFGVSVAFGMTLGASLCSPIDTSSNLKDKIIGVGLAVVLVPLASIILTLLYNHTFIFYIVFATFVFFSSLIALYGQRASMMSFTLLLGISLSFIHITNTSNAIANGLNMFYGGALYLTISIIFYLIRPTTFINLQLSLSIDNVAQYLRLRAQMWADNADVDGIRSKQLGLQVIINDSLQKINQYLDFNKMQLVNSANNYKLVLATSFLNQIMELAITTTFNNKDADAELDKQLHLRNTIKTLTEGFADTLEQLSESIRLRRDYTFTDTLSQQLTQVQTDLNQITALSNENKIYIDNIIDYLSKQIKKIEALERVCTDKMNTTDLKLNYEQVAKYFTPSLYRFKTLIENLNFKSTYFRYAMRLSFAMLIGLIFGDFIALNKEYWVLLTIVVIMRPGYGLTKSRMNQRVVGTAIGGLAGIFILYFVTDTLVLSILTAIAMLLGYWYSSSNYKIGVTFTTLYVIMIYGILKTGADISVIYRITDTMMGALIALLATHFLWPSWESSSVKNNLIASINSTIAYLDQFKQLYLQKAIDAVEVQKTRKDAFIAIGNLMSSYQRLVQEPKNKQQNRAELYEIAVLNQTLVDATSSLGSFIRAHQDNTDLKEYAGTVDTILSNLNLSLKHFELISTDETPSTATHTDTILPTSESIEATATTTNSDQIDQLDESKLVLDQLSWMVGLSEQIEMKAREVR